MPTEGCPSFARSVRKGGRQTSERTGLNVQSERGPAGENRLAHKYPLGYNKPG